jgi:hypothetical protein
VPANVSFDGAKWTNDITHPPFTRIAFAGDPVNVSVNRGRTSPGPSSRGHWRHPWFLPWSAYWRLRDEMT